MLIRPPRLCRPWQIWIDTGGTFTDCIAIDPDGARLTTKVLSSGALRATISRIDGKGRLHLASTTTIPRSILRGYSLSLLGTTLDVEITRHDPASGALELAEHDASIFTVGDSVEIRSGEEAPLLATRIVTATPLDESLPPLAMRLATTRGTNALLERRGARLVHFTTAGFEDLLHIAEQQRPDLFALAITRPKALPDRILGIPERLDATGSILQDLDVDALRGILDDADIASFDSASIALLHGHRNPVHEQQLESVLREYGITDISSSSELSPFQGLLLRSQTATADGYLGPIISSYLGAVRQRIGSDRSSLHVMTSAGGLVNTESYRAMDSLLSGPAGGVVGAAMSGRAAGATKIIAFDMGGTSTDVSRHDGDFEYVFSHRVGPVTLAAPALAIETVAAGGGSVCTVDQGRLVVGPESAGAYPGPASYGAGGPLTLTDVNLLLGRLVPDRFPIPVDAEAARRAFAGLRSTLGDDAGGDEEAILEGLLRIADERMAEAIRHISVRKGVDPAEYCLVAFGGAGGQHACRVAEILGISEVILPGDAGLLSALGLGHAVVERFAERELLCPLEELERPIDEILAELEASARRDLADEGIGKSDFDISLRSAELRYRGQDATLEIQLDAGLDLGAEFEKRYFDLFSYRPDNRGIELVSLRVVARSRRRGIEQPRNSCRSQPAVADGEQRCFLDGKWRQVPCFEANAVQAGMRITGPALIHQQHSSIVLPSQWTLQGVGAGSLRLRIDPKYHSSQITRRPQAVELELMSHRFASIAREMGEMLRRTAVSTNIKEREDFSCTLLDPQGRLVVNAPHIPVHLGAMGLCVREILAHRKLAAGDVVVTNHPAFGGSHLPDVTLVAPVHLGETVLGYVACRAHHAEIGGIRPGSVPPAATSLAQEGVVIPPTLLVDRGQPCWDSVEAILTGGPFPTRMIDDNLADLRAMLAAVGRGRAALQTLADRVGADHVSRFMDALRNQARREIEKAFEALGDGRYEARQQLDDGTPIVARFTIKGRRATLDFSGSGGVHPGNLNATPAIVTSAVMYVMRLLVEVDLPLNEGLLEALDITIPRSILNPRFDELPERSPAVVGGNVETSQRIVDTLIRALGLAAGSQGTMNNLSFGNASFGYYETVAGGSGATNGHDGASGVHTHMTNTRITDPEVLEHRYPVRLHRFALRQNSGGPGRWTGGEGVIREFEFLAELELSILSQHRQSGAFGMHGGKDGQPGQQWIRHPDGRQTRLAGIDGCEVEPGDRLILETPGGGGWGEPER